MIKKLIFLIILILISIWGFQYLSRSRPQKLDDEVVLQLGAVNLLDAIENFKKYYGRYPTNKEGLLVLIKCEKLIECANYPKNGFLHNDFFLQDPWGNPYVYVQKNNSEYSIFSVRNNQKIDIIKLIKK